jgi:hypothetical protein
MDHFGDMTGSVSAGNHQRFQGEIFVLPRQLSAARTKFSAFNNQFFATRTNLEKQSFYLGKTFITKPKPFLSAI